MNLVILFSPINSIRSRCELTEEASHRQYREVSAGRRDVQDDVLNILHMTFVSLCASDFGFCSLCRCHVVMLSFCRASCDANAFFETPKSRYHIKMYL